MMWAHKWAFAPNCDHGLGGPAARLPREARVPCVICYLVCRLRVMTHFHRSRPHGQQTAALHRGGAGCVPACGPPDSHSLPVMERVFDKRAISGRLALRSTDVPPPWCGAMGAGNQFRGPRQLIPFPRFLRIARHPERAGSAKKSSTTWVSARGPRPECCAPHPRRSQTSGLLRLALKKSITISQCTEQRMRPGRGGPNLRPRRRPFSAGLFHERLCHRASNPDPKARATCLPRSHTAIGIAKRHRPGPS